MSHRWGIFVAIALIYVALLFPAGKAHADDIDLEQSSPKKSSK
jgi:hypothetical protein